MPYNVDKFLGDAEMDEEGRIITAEYSKFYLVCVYVPNAGRKLVNLDRRLRWNKLFEKHVNDLKAKKPGSYFFLWLNNFLRFYLIFN